MSSRARSLWSASRFILRPYQVDMLHYLLERDLFALFVDPRLGKTLPVVRRILMSAKSIERILIAAPHSALYGWETTIKSEGEKSIAYLTGERPKRVAMLKSRCRWNLINKEGFRSIPEISDVPWDAVICDESTFLKNPQSEISDFWVKHFRSARIRGIMTGTPAPESELEYFQQLMFLDKSILGYNNYWHFRNDWFINPDWDTYGWYMKHAGKQFLESKLKGFCFVLKRSDVRGNEKSYIIREVELPEKMREVYRKAEEDFVLALPDSDEEQSTIWSMTQYIWLRNIASGVIEDKVYDDFKITALVEFITGEMAGLKSIIWCAYTQEQTAVCAYLRKQKVKTDIINGNRTPKVRERVRQQFMNGELQHVIAQPQCFRHGTDLSGADYMNYFSRPVGLETSQQSEDRIINMDIDEVKDIVDWVTADTVDWSILKSLRGKERRSLTMLRIIQDAKRRQNEYSCKSQIK
jgi:SNF2 family DNA or RNA helicase